MRPPPPPIHEATDDRRCHNCAGWVEDPHLVGIGDCRLGPDPRRAFRPGVVLRMTAPDQVCDGFEEAWNVAAERQRVAGK